MKEIVAALSAIREPGFFVGKNQAPANALSLEIKGLGLLKWPLTETCVRQLIALAQPAHFGWRDQTVLDKNVRDVWKISASEIRIEETEWNKTLHPVLETLRKDLGLPENSELQADLHDLLIYEPGQFFHPHQDSEKCNGMVATMVMVLPSAHTGGNLIIDHRGVKKTIQSSRFSPDQLHFIAFYADCYHEVKPVKSGYRVALTYHLILKNSVRSVPSVIHTAENQALMQALTDYFPDAQYSQEPDYIPPKGVYLLDHEYTQAGLSWRHLKNADYVRADSLKRAADHAGLEIYLTLVDIREHWSCAEEFDDSRSSRGRRRYEYDDEEETVTEYSESSIELIELIEEEIALRHWLDREGHPVNLREAGVSEDELGWTKPTDQFKPFQTEYEGWMGNYGNTLERWYHRAAIVFWRKADHYPMLFQNNPASVIQELIHSYESGRALPLPGPEIVRSLLPLWPKYLRRADAALLGEVLQLAGLLQDAELSQKILQPFMIKVLTPESVTLCLPLIEAYGVPWFLDILHDWSQAKDTWDRVEPCEHILPLVNILVKNHAHKPLIDFLLAYQWRQLQTRYAGNKGIHYRSELSRAMRQLIQYVHDLLKACRIVHQEALMNEIVDHLVSDPRCYPLLELMALIDDCETSSRQKLLNYLYAGLQKESDGGLRQPDDWSIQEKITCECEDCAVLTRFLESRCEKEKIWPLAQGRRQHIHQAIQSLNIPVTHETQHTGSPHKLILIKTEKLHSQARTRFTQVQQALLRLGAEMEKMAINASATLR